MRRKDRGWWEFDPEKSFFSLTVVRITFVFFAVLAGLVAVVICSNENLVWDFSAAGFNLAIELFKVPLGISALLIPLVALLAGNHRSEQTVHQFGLLQSQNNFQNYHQHREEFRSHCDSLNELGVGRIPNPNKFHSTVFYFAKEGDLRPSSIMLDELKHFGTQLIAQYNRIEREKNMEEFIKHLQSIQIGADILMSFGVSFNNSLYICPIRVNGSDFEVFGGSAEESLEIYRMIFILLFEASFFSERAPKELLSIFRQINSFDINDVWNYLYLTEYEG
jgi:hypothetical protein